MSQDSKDQLRAVQSGEGNVYQLRAVQSGEGNISGSLTQVTGHQGSAEGCTVW